MFTAKKNGGSIFSLGQADWKAAGSTGQILCQRMVLFMCTVDSMSQDKLGSCKCGSSPHMSVMSVEEPSEQLLF